jgi:hypothetical protein
MRTLSTVELYLGNILLGRIRRQIGQQVDISVPKSLEYQQRPLGYGFLRNRWNWRTPGTDMTICRITETSVDISAEVIKWVYLKHSRLLSESGEGRENITHGGLDNTLQNDPIRLSISSSSTRDTFEDDSITLRSTSDTKVGDSSSEPDAEEGATDQSEILATSLKLRLFTAEANVQLGEKMKQELERATKKKPPTKVKVSLIYVSSDQPLSFSYLFSLFCLQYLSE